MNANIYAQFKFSQHKEKPLFILEHNKILTYADIDRRVAQFCQVFQNLGLKPGDRVLQNSEKSIDAFCVYLASLRFGTIYVPLNPAFQRDELSYFIEDTKASLFICSLEQRETIEELILGKKYFVIVETLGEEGQGSLQEKAKDLERSFEIQFQSNDSAACILYTSGTTGRPKGAILSHQNLFSNALELKHLWDFKHSDVLLHALPIFHCHGLFFASHTVLLSGAAMIFLPKFEVDSIIKKLDQSTVFMGVPTYYTRLLENADFNRDRTQTIRLFVSGSAPLSEQTFTQFEEKIGHRILERYGMTETGINTSNPLQATRIPGSVGKALSGTQLRIMNEEGEPLKNNEIGEIQVKSDAVFKNYWKKEHEHASFFTADEYFKTGDLGFIDHNDYLYIVGRAKDLIISGGLNIYPKEIEIALDQLEGIQGSAVIGLPHPDFGEAVTAVVIAQEQTNEYQDFVIKELKKSLASYKVPKKIIFTDTLSKNVMGKVQKNILREQYANLYVEK